MRHFAEYDYTIDRAISRYNGVPHLAKECNCWDGYCRVPGTKPCAPGSCEKCDSHSKKSSEINSQPFANPVPLEEQPGYTAGGAPIEQSLESAPSAVGTGKEASAHKVEEKDDKFYVTEEGEGEVAGPFDSQEEAYSRANELNDLENLETEETHKDNAEEKPAGGVSLTITMAKALAMKEAAYRKKAAQGDKPSPHAAKAVFDALCEGNEDLALDLIGQTDCPENCETHAEGKCNHGFMSAGRTRVRYLIGSQAFKNADENPKATGTVGRDQKEAAFGFGIIKRLLKMFMAGQCPVCEGKGQLMKAIPCPACDATGQAQVFKSKVGEFNQNQLPEIVDRFKSQIGAPSTEDEFEFDDDPFDIGGSSAAGSDEPDLLDDPFDLGFRAGATKTSEWWNPTTWFGGEDNKTVNTPTSQGPMTTANPADAPGFGGIMNNIDLTGEFGEDGEPIEPTKPPIDLTNEFPTIDLTDEFEPPALSPDAIKAGQDQLRRTKEWEAQYGLDWKDFAKNGLDIPPERWQDAAKQLNDPRFEA